MGLPFDFFVCTRVVLNGLVSIKCKRRSRSEVFGLGLCRGLSNLECNLEEDS